MYGRYFIWVSILLFFIFLILSRKIYLNKHSRIGLTALTFFYLFISGVYVVSDIFTGHGIDDSVIYHLIYGFGGAGFKNYLGIIF